MLRILPLPLLVLLLLAVTAHSAPVISRIVDVSEVDLDGDFQFAISYGMDPSESYSVNGVYFTSDLATECTSHVGGPNRYSSWVPNMLEGPQNEEINNVLKSIRWANREDWSITLDLPANAGANTYKLQLLFAEGCCNRRFDVSINGVIVEDFNPGVIQGSTGSGADAAAMISHIITDATGSVEIVLISEVWGGDRNPILNALTLEHLSGPDAPAVLENPTPVVNFIELASELNRGIGIDHYEIGNRLVMSVNYQTGSHTDPNFEIVNADGSHTQFSDVSGLRNEIKIATVRSGSPGGFVAGDLFTGNGVEGDILRITDGGATVENPWVSLGAGEGLLRGSLYHDRTGVWDGDLIVVTTKGNVWRVSADKTATKVAVALDDGGNAVHLEGVITVPDDEVRYGPLAGCIIAGAEDTGGFMYAFKTDGSYSKYDVDVDIEDIDFIDGGNFYGVDFRNNRLLAARFEDWLPFRGDILLTQEYPGNGLPMQLGILHFNRNCGGRLEVVPVTGAPGSETPAQWEHVTFSTAGIEDLDIPDQFGCCDYESGSYVGTPIEVSSETTSVTITFTDDSEPASQCT